MHRTNTTTAPLAGLLLLAVGCANGDTSKHLHDFPVIERGVCATVIMPGESVPMGSQPGCAGGYSAIGRTAVQEQGEKTTHRSPRVPGQELVTVPLAIATYPVRKAAQLAKKAKNAMDRDDESKPADEEHGTLDPVSAQQAQQARQRAAMDPQQAWEQAQLEALQRQLAQQGAGATGAQAPAPSAPTGDVPRAPLPEPDPRRLASAQPSHRSIADELASLRASTRPVAQPSPELAEPGAQRASEGGVADRVTDRNGDGRPDHWVYQEGGRPVRELFDEDGDGHPDRTVYYDPATGQETRVEEDRNLDGKIDSWVEYKDGKIARDRRDSDHDGIPDTWSFYRDGQLTRQEQATRGDGFRDRVALFHGGHLAKEREDLDGDGRVDRVTLYDDSERIRQRDEDKNGDGLVDTRSYYENGRLVRRELVDQPSDIEGEQLEGTAWDAGDPKAD